MHWAKMRIIKIILHKFFNTSLKNKAKLESRQVSDHDQMTSYFMVSNVLFCVMLK